MEESSGSTSENVERVIDSSSGKSGDALSGVAVAEFSLFLRLSSSSILERVVRVFFVSSSSKIAVTKLRAEIRRMKNQRILWGPASVQ